VNQLLPLWIAIAAAAATCLAAVAGRAIGRFSPSEIKELGGRHGHDRTGEMLKHRDRVAVAIDTLQLAATVVFTLAAAAWLLNRWSGDGGTNLVASCFAACLLLALAEVWLPWAIARLWANPFLYHTWPLWRLVAALLAPLGWLARFVDTVIHRLAGRSESMPDEEAFEEDIRTIVSEGHREGLLEEDACEMIEGVIELGDADVSQIMTPRTDMICMPAALSWPEALAFVVKAGHTRIPVYGKNRDDIVGVLYTKDLLPQLAKKPEDRAEPWTKLLREPVFLPETKPIDDLLQQFQRGRHHMAVVLDEYGGVSGLVTMEDVLEEIVGEIVDEYDGAAEEGIRQVSPGVSEVLGRVHVDEVNERLDLELPEDAEFDTIGGFVFSELGHIPVIGEELTWHNVRITVLEASRRRIERLRLEVLDHVPQASDARSGQGLG
jgi:CBS domain containing-hemolysin-like protein